jgi:hypothetical protein
MRSRTPAVSALNALSVSDGQTTIGTIAERDGAYFALNADGVLIGEHHTRVDAMRALPWAAP